MLTSATIRLAPIMSEHMYKFTKSNNVESSSGSLSKNFQSAITLATSYTVQGVKDSERGEEEEGGNGDKDIDDIYGVGAIFQAFNTVEMCVRYTDRLNKDITRAGETVFSLPIGEGKLIC